MRRKLLMLCVAVLVVIVVITGGLMFIDNMVKKRTNWHTFELDSVPRFLTEEMAITFALKTLAQEGFDAAVWELQRDGRTVDPDGHTDKYVARNALNHNRVSMMFLNKAEGKARGVSVEMEDKRVVCAVTIPK